MTGAIHYPNFCSVFAQQMHFTTEVAQNFGIEVFDPKEDVGQIRFAKYEFLKKLFKISHLGNYPEHP